jgi:formate dehydrogenase subunit beta
MNTHDVLAQIGAIADQLLSEYKVIGVVGLLSEHGHVGPYLFTAPEDIAALALEPRYSIALICREVLSNLSEGRLGVVVRGCDERALIEMAKLEQVNLDRLVFIGVACSSELAQLCECTRPFPSRIDAGKKVGGIALVDDGRTQKLLEQSVEERLEFWQAEFAHCIKCYGCRNVCPVCICDECVLEETCWIERGRIPPSLPFHLIRLYHVADKCVGCGACEAVCPMDIPLSTLYTLFRERLSELFDYEPGLDLVQRSPLTTTLEEMPFTDSRRA